MPLDAENAPSSAENVCFAMYVATCLVSLLRGQPRSVSLWGIQAVLWMHVYQANSDKRDGSLYGHAELVKKLGPIETA